MFGVGVVARLGEVLHGAGLTSDLGYDPGVYFAAADGLVHGRVPYRDFVLLHPPGIMLAVAPFALATRRDYSWRPETLADIDDYKKDVGNILHGVCYKRYANQSFTFGNGVTVVNSYGASVEGVSLTVKDTWTQDVAVYFQYVENGEFCGDDYRGTLYSQHFDGDHYIP